MEQEKKILTVKQNETKKQFALTFSWEKAGKQENNIKKGGNIKKNRETPHCLNFFLLQGYVNFFEA